MTKYNKALNITQQLHNFTKGTKFITFIISKDELSNNFNSCNILRLTEAKTKKEALAAVNPDLTDIYCYSIATQAFTYEIGKWKPLKN
jgi:hypothetical protein